MTAARKLGKFRGADINADIDAGDLPPEVWTDGVNVNWRSNELQRIQGASMVLNGAPAAPVHHLAARDALLARWIYATVDNTIYVTDGVIHSDITPTPAPAPVNTNPWNSCTLNGVPVVNWGVGAPVSWDGNASNPMTVIPGFLPNTSVDVIRAYKSYLIGLAPTIDGVRNEDGVIWSDAAAPGELPSTWIPAADNDAGDAQLATTTGLILDGASMRDTFVVYKRSGTYSLDFIGGNFVFRTRTLFPNLSILGRNCVVEHRGLHYVFTDGDIVRHDGNTVQSIVDRRWRRTVFEEMSNSAFGTSFVCLYTAQNEVWFCYAGQGSPVPDRALVYNYEQDAIGYRLFNAPVSYGVAVILPNDDIDRSYDAQTASYEDYIGPYDVSNFSAKVDRLLLADNSAQFHLVDDGDLYPNGDAVSGLVERVTLDLGDPDRVKTVKAVWPRLVNAGGTLEIRLGYQYALHDPVAWEQWIAFDTQQARVPAFTTGRFISLQIASSNGGAWRCSGFDLEYEHRGRF
jgi:hypothetical protein